MAHDVFLSYSKEDKAAADAVCHALERNRIRVWMAPRDSAVGVGWAESIINAINDARVLVLVFSGNANTSPQIEREVERAVSKRKHIVSFRIEEVAPSMALEYFLSAPHWLDAFPPPVDQHLQPLADAVKNLLKLPVVTAPAPPKGPTDSEKTGELTEERARENDAIAKKQPAEEGLGRTKNDGAATGNLTVKMSEAARKPKGATVSATPPDVWKPKQLAENLQGLSRGALAVVLEFVANALSEIFGLLFRILKWIWPLIIAGTIAMSRSPYIKIQGENAAKQQNQQRFLDPPQAPPWKTE